MTPEEAVVSLVKGGMFGGMPYKPMEGGSWGSQGYYSAPARPRNSFSNPHVPVPLQTPPTMDARLRGMLAVPPPVMASGQ
jgi:hypothetical protein